MDIKLERAIIRTFKKLREMYDENGEYIKEKMLSPSEMCGIFVNFCYSEYGVHAGLNTTYINIYKPGPTWKIWFNDKRQYYRTEFSNLIDEALSELQDHEFYSMWLRASFENPKDDTWSHPVVREALKNYKGIQDTHYDNYLYLKEVYEVYDEVDRPTDTQSVGLNFSHTPNIDKMIGKLNLKNTLSKIKPHR